MTKHILITGATAGIGLDTAIDIAKHTKNDDVVMILANRNREKAEKVKAQLAQYTDNLITLVDVDFDSLDSVNQCANELLQRYNSIDVLINNAGLFVPEECFTQDGYEKHIGVNFIAPVLLTEKLLPLLQKNSTPARIIHVASMAHLVTRKMDFDNFKGWVSFQPVLAYGQSKLGNLLYSKQLAKRLSQDPKTAHITSNALHPGGANSHIYRDMNIIIRKFMSLVSINTKAPAKRIRIMALSPKWENKTGQYISVQTPAWQSKLAKDDVLGKKLVAYTHGLLAKYLT